MIELLAEPARVVVGTESTVTIRVVNRGSGSCSNVRVDLEVPGALGLRRGSRRVRLRQLPARTTHDERLVVLATEAGTHAIGVPNFSFLDQLGLPHRERGVTIPVVAEQRSEPETSREPRGSIFVSYRRADTGHVAQSLADALVEAFPHHVFHDHTSLRPGDDFRRRLDRELAACEVLLALIGPRWLTVATKDGGPPRLCDPEDLVRHEIVTGLKSGVVLIPVLVDDAVMPERAELTKVTADLGDLADRQAVRLRADTPTGQARVVDAVRYLWRQR